MALVKNVMVLFFFWALIEVSFVVVYEVGDFRGWSNDSNIDYKSWASTKEFRVEDTIRKLFLSLFLFITVFNIRIENKDSTCGESCIQTIICRT